jgi:hypothetical protein
VKMLLKRRRKTTMKARLNKLSNKMAALATVSFMLGSSEAFAGKGFTGVTKNITASTSTIPNLVSTVAYIGGLGLGVAGVLKLKAHVDNPQTPLKDGLVRLGAGGGLLALPFVLQSMTSTIGTGGAVTAITLPAAP